MPANHDRYQITKDAKKQNSLGNFNDFKEDVVFITILNYYPVYYC